MNEWMNEWWMNDCQCLWMNDCQCLWMPEWMVANCQCLWMPQWMNASIFAYEWMPQWIDCSMPSDCMSSIPSRITLSLLVINFAEDAMVPRCCIICKSCIHLDDTSFGCQLGNGNENGRHVLPPSLLLLLFVHDDLEFHVISHGSVPFRPSVHAQLGFVLFDALAEFFGFHKEV